MYKKESGKDFFKIFYFDDALTMLLHCFNKICKAEFQKFVNLVGRITLGTLASDITNRVKIFNRLSFSLVQNSRTNETDTSAKSLSSTATSEIPVLNSHLIISSHHSPQLLKDQNDRTAELSSSLVRNRHKAQA